MKTDIVTATLAAIAGVVVAFVLCNLLIPEVASVDFKTLSADASYSLTQPNEEVFNYRALNPTVEVYVGECQQYGANNECIDDQNNTDDSGDSEDSGESDGSGDSGDSGDSGGGTDAEE